MDLSKFGAEMSGELAEINLSPSISHAFVPNPLPPNWTIPSNLWPLIAEARAAIASLDGIGKHLLNPDLLIRPLQHREAQASSQLEGTITNPQQQLLFEQDGPVEASESQSENLREVSNYKKALNYYRKLGNDRPLSLWMIRTLHELLLAGVRGEQNLPGQFRQVQVVIGRPPRFVPPPPYLVLPLLENLEQYVITPASLDPLVDSFMIHYQFETIHPFRDGNGRVGRLLLALMIMKRCRLADNWLYMSAYYDSHRDEYIDRLFRVSAYGDWEGWIEFCLRGAISQAQDTEQRCNNLLKLSNYYRETLARHTKSGRLYLIIDHLFVSPVVQITVLSEKLSMHYQTIQKDLDYLVKQGILVEMPGTRPKAYYCPEIMNLIYEGVTDIN